ncbi:MAG: DUF4364 family protein [Clostridia bacterium]|nr:DUF4364 family protein [Clostridia bacterium]
MERKHIPETENRLTILYALRRLGPATGMQLLQFLVELDLMNYFTLQLSLSDLKEQGQLTAVSHPLGDLLTLTQQGEYAIESFAHHIPLSRRQLMDTKAPLWRERFRTEQLAPADSFTLQDGRVCLRLRLLEGHASLLDILITLPRNAPPTFLEKRWRVAAQAVYDAVTLQLSQGFEPGAAPDLPASAAMEQTGSQEWTLSLVDSTEHPTLTLLLPLADEALARHCAARWPEQCEALRSHILQELNNSVNE